MANRGRHEFSVQEAVNMDSFVSWSYEELDMASVDTAAGKNLSSYITEANPAKKVVLYLSPAATDALDAADTLTLTINGEATTRKQIVIDPGDFPFTLSGMMITSLLVTPGGGNAAGEEVSVLSFH